MALGVIADLRARRLLPVAAILLVLVIAVPVVLSKPAESVAPAKPTPAASASVNGLPSPASALNNDKPLVTLAVLDKPSDLRGYNTKDPFKPLVPVAKANDASATGATGAAASTDGSTSAASPPAGGGSSGGSPGGGAPTGGGSPGGGSPGGGSTGGGTTVTPKITHYTYEIDATVKTPAGKKRLRHLRRLSFLPSQSNPLLIFLGVTSDGQSALVLISDSRLHPVGGGGAHCRPTHAKCTAVWFQAGESYTFVDAKDGKYVLKVHSIKAVAVSDKKAKGASAEGSGAAGLSAIGVSPVPAAAPPLVNLITGG